MTHFSVPDSTTTRIINQTLTNEFHETFIPFNDKNETQNWNLDSGYLVDDLDTFPIRASVLGFGRFMIYLKYKNIDLVNRCQELQNSYRVHFHMPNEMSSRVHLSTLVPNNTMQLISLTAKIHSASDDWRSYSPEVRKCYFQNERKLKFYKSYTKVHCDVECLTNYTLKVCNCSKFSYVRDKNTKVCGMADIECCIQVAQNFPYANELGKNNPFPCKCYPPCNYIKYGIKSINQLPLDTTKFNRSDE